MINIIYMYKLYIFKIYFVYPKSAVTQTSLMSFISIFFFLLSLLGGGVFLVLGIYMYIVR